jgi:hypothetical protein
LRELRGSSFAPLSLGVTVAVTGVVVPLRVSLTVVPLIVLACIASENDARTSAVGQTPVAPDDGLTVVTVGATESTFQLCVAGDASRFPAESVAETPKVWLPWLREE